MSTIRFACALALLPLAGCAHVGREDAGVLSQVGVKAAAALGDDVQVRATRLAALRQGEDFSAAYVQLLRCGAVYETLADAQAAARTAAESKGAAPAPVEQDCVVTEVAKRRKTQAVGSEAAKTASRFKLRADAIRALGDAYQALGDEAAFDQAGEVDKALGPAVDAANDFAKLFGVAAIAKPLLAGVKAAGHALAVDAQKRRLLRASRAISAVTHQVKTALMAERRQFGLTDQLLFEMDASTRERLLQAGLLDPSATIRSVAQNVGVAVPDTRLSTAVSGSPALRGAGEVATLNGFDDLGLADFDLAIEILGDLEIQHFRLEEGKRLDTRRIDGDVARLAALIGSKK